LCNVTHNPNPKRRWIATEECGKLDHLLDSLIRSNQAEVQDLSFISLPYAADGRDTTSDRDDARAVLEPWSEANQVLPLALGREYNMPSGYGKRREGQAPERMGVAHLVKRHYAGTNNTQQVRPKRSSVPEGRILDVN
jgi:hypothetical protein